MRKVGDMVVYSHEEMLDRVLGEKGTPLRNEHEARMEAFLLGEALKKARLEQVLTTREIKDATVKERVEDIYLVVSWREIAHQYFGRTAAWLYQRFRGLDSNGNEGGFSEKEKEQLRSALHDLSRRINACAETI